MSSQEWKETDNMKQLEKELADMKKAWDDICDAFGVDSEIRLQPDVLKNNIRATLIDFEELQTMDYVRKSGKQLENLSETYLKCLIRSAFMHVKTDDSTVWKEEVERFLNDVLTPEILGDLNVRVEEDNCSSEQLFADIQRVFSIANQLNIIRGMEKGNVSPEMFMSLEDNFIYLHIAIVQTCNGNAVIMGKAVSFIKALIKINDNILKSISQMLSR